MAEIARPWHQVPMLRNFALCADDYALSPAVSLGIRAALAAGRLSATGAMTTRPCWPQAARELRELDADADIGLHFNLTLGAPLTAMPQLAPGGRLPPIGTIMRLAALPEAEIRAELDAQLDAFRAEMGREPDFLDGHQHVHMLAGIRDIVLRALAARGLAGRLWLRSSADMPWRILARGAFLPKALGLAWLGRGFAAEARGAGFAVNDGFAGFSGFDPAADYGGQFGRYLAAPGPRHLVMCHPGHVDAELAALDPVTATREQELAFLLSDRFARMLEARGMRLARLSAAPWPEAPPRIPS